jgi:GTPase SAR1 family protein
MGASLACCAAKQGKDKAAVAQDDMNKSKEVEKQLDQMNQTMYKLLLLGPGESGKSTFFKQMVIGYGHGFDDKDMTGFTSNVRECVISNVKKLAEALPMLLPNEQLSNEGKEAADYISEFSNSNLLPDEEFAQQCTVLWSEPAVQKLWNDKRNEIQVPEALSFFVPGRLDAIIKEDYVPSVEDIMRVRVRTSGIIECRFTVNGANFSLCDVGGQRSERRKWIRCFADVKTVLFLVAVAEYDQTIFEDEKTNRVVEALTVFEGLLKESTFAETPFVIFFNKMDLFRVKIASKVPLTAFPDYTGPVEEGPVLDFIQEKFKKLFEATTKGKRKLYMHQTMATDRDNCLKVFDVVRSSVIEQALGQFEM